MCNEVASLSKKFTNSLTTVGVRIQFAPFSYTVEGGGAARRCQEYDTFWHDSIITTVSCHFLKSGWGPLSKHISLGLYPALAIDSSRLSAWAVGFSLLSQTSGLFGEWEDLRGPHFILVSKERVPNEGSFPVHIIHHYITQESLLK